ncbi:hypothetical protein [Tenacibaculum maritimum]|uniref:hypothetical protein n=1 Tax=Tenacibaculum maritimum TaxID=107401 RepID=UPI0038760B54
MIKERLIQVIEYKGIAKEVFYKKIGMTSASFRGSAKKTPLNSNAIENILSEITDLNSYWLLTGKGSMLKNVEKIGVNQNIIGDGSTMIGGSIYGDNPSVSKIKEYEKEIKEKDKEIKRLKNQIDTLFKMLQK